MRTRDQAKYDSIVDSTIKLTNELSFDGISISKISKMAKVSPATIYIYFKNKEDLFTKLYIDIREKMSQGALEGLQEGMNTEEAFKSIWYHSFTFNLEHPAYLVYREHFEQTSMMKNIKPQGFRLFQIVSELFKQGVDERSIKDYPLPILTAFAYAPIITLLKYHQMDLIKMNKDTIKKASEIAWNAIRL